MTRKLIVIFLALIAVTAYSTAVNWAQTGQSDAQSAAERRALFRRGARLWPVYCNTCHNARPASEFSPAEWNMIMMHMRTQANLPAKDAQAVLEYLKASR